jgi:tRNA-dihydrouridine synthase
VYNGDILEIKSEELKMKNLAGAKFKGLMIGRGLLAHPWMLGDKEPAQVLHDMHAIVYRHAVETLCGDSQTLSRLHAFWEYADIPHKQKKAIMKATTLTRYREAVAALACLPASS